MDVETGRSLARLVRAERIAHLATLRAGAPLVSMTLYMPSPDFSAFYVHVSRLAWHTQDMQHDARVALSIAETDDRRADPFTLMRITIRGEARNIANDAGDFQALKAAWLARFPEQAINFQLADFSFWKITPRDARFVAGFGRIHNLSAAELLAHCANCGPGSS
ncbi:MAG TPA: pyridoxamine 5'-phosphate oxidase family protein [Burkholderiales bacterium]|nr:pyridoxamine 5'-phosphate oxidase family protein [Burkholderiales bacterium]